MELRLAVPPDALAVARVHVRSWQVGYRGLLPGAYLDGLLPEDRAARYTFDRRDGPRTTVAIVGRAIAGFATIHDDELAALYVDPDAWGTGIGRALVSRARADLAAAGATAARLWLLDGNVRGERFYERDGLGDRRHASRADRLGRDRRRDRISAAARAVAAIAGQIEYRARPGRRGRRIHRASETSRDLDRDLVLATDSLRNRAAPPPRSPVA